MMLIHMTFGPNCLIVIRAHLPNNNYNNPFQIHKLDHFECYDDKLNPSIIIIDQISAIMKQDQRRQPLTQGMWESDFWHLT